ncbi:hypothetical protein COU76_02190 [Candidatus Peregrinibacteria bacterium CG10_big_fil_rev_8_21_14_0_10_49_10]|nr:MAG: hypothetical protein COU76_02190 [Candidatus Peregrinibacteria bacterium CG10_big_fil_rev_8_21_14_0_10_49_10]
MRIKDALRQSGLSSLDAEVLVAALLQKERSWVLAQTDTDLTNEQSSLFQACCTRRRKHEPLAYILRQKEFYGRRFSVNPHVLIPRPATEGLIDAACAFLTEGEQGLREVDTHIAVLVHTWRNESPDFLVDVGTGSGCIAITLALETGRSCTATDTSREALGIARSNAQLHGVAERITFVQGSLLAPLTHVTAPFFLVSNPPYIPDGEKLMQDVAEYEPHQALFGGHDGMGVLLPLFLEAKQHPFCVGCALECRSGQAQKLMQIL